MLLAEAVAGFAAAILAVILTFRFYKRLPVLAALISLVTGFLLHSAVLVVKAPHEAVSHDASSIPANEDLPHRITLPAQPSEPFKYSAGDWTSHGFYDQTESPSPAVNPMAPSVVAPEVPPAELPGPSEADGPRIANRMAILGRAMNALPVAKIVLVAPSSMVVGEEKKVEARVGYKSPIDDLHKNVRPDDQALDGTLHASEEMIAALDGPGFKITAITADRQRIAEGFVTSWSWIVEAKASGKQDLDVTLYALIPLGKQEAKQRIDSYDQTINVSVQARSWGDWMDTAEHQLDGIKGAVATIAGGATVVIGWLSLRKDWKKHRKPPRVAEDNSTAGEVGVSVD